MNKKEMSAHLNNCEDCTQSDSDHEDEEEDPMRCGVPLRVEYGEENKACTTDEGAHARKGAEDAFSRAHVRH